MYGPGSSEIACGGNTERGCGAVLAYPTGSPYVRCALCNHVTDTRATVTATATESMRCEGCEVMMRFPRDATHVRCALCETVSVNPRAAASARHGSMRDPFDLFALAARRSASGRDMAYARCDGCRSMLAYAAGSTAVRCAACGTVTRTHSSETPAAAATSGGDTGRARVQGARLTRENLVVIENPPTVTANGKIRSNIAVGVKLDE
tara:strand:- start:3906 stop:4526 length:621 start_codon:yes stop_codon:yes gene_type:complete